MVNLIDVYFRAIQKGNSALRLRLNKQCHCELSLEHVKSWPTEPIAMFDSTKELVAECKLSLRMIAVFVLPLVSSVLAASKYCCVSVFCFDFEPGEACLVFFGDFLGGSLCTSIK